MFVAAYRAVLHLLISLDTQIASFIVVILLMAYIVFVLLRIYHLTFIYVTDQTISISQIKMTPVRGDWRTAGEHFYFKKEIKTIAIHEIESYSLKKNLFLKPLFLTCKNGEQVLWETVLYHKKQWQDVLRHAKV